MQKTSTASCFAFCMISAILVYGCNHTAQHPQTKPIDKLNRIEGWVPYWIDAEAVVLNAAAAGFTDILFFNGTVCEAGGVTIDNPESLERGRIAAAKKGARSWFTVTNHGKTLEGALGPDRLEAHVKSLLTAFVASRCEHLDLNYENMTPAQAARLPALARLLDKRMPPDVQLSFTLQPVDERLRPHQKITVLRLLSMARVYTVRFMMYDYSWRNSFPGALCSLPAYHRLLDAWAGYEQKLTVCLPLYGYDWPRPDDVSLPRADTILLSDVKNMSAEFVWMRNDGELAARYTRNGIRRMAAIPSHRAINIRVESALDYGVSAVSFWHLGAADDLNKVVEACRRDGRITEGFYYTETDDWSEWLDPFKRRVYRKIIGDGRSLSEIAKQYGIETGTMLRFNQHVIDTTKGQTIYLPFMTKEDY